MGNSGFIVYFDNFSYVFQNREHEQYKPLQRTQQYWSYRHLVHRVRELGGLALSLGWHRLSRTHVSCFRIRRPADSAHAIAQGP